MTEKMTRKDYFNLIKDVMADNADVVAFCEKEIAAIENKAVKAKERAAKKAAEGDALKEAVYAALTNEPMTAAEIVEKVGGEATVGKVQYRANALIKDGKAVKGEVIVEGDGKTRKLVGYMLAEQPNKRGHKALFYFES